MTSLLSPPNLRRLQNEGGVEFVNGQLHEKAVSIRSCLVASEIAHLLMTETRQAESAQVFTSSMGYQCFTDDPLKVRKPDVSLVRCKRLHGHDDNEAFIRLPPDLSVEVVSRNALPSGLEDRIQDYLANGFPLIWIVYPSSKTVTIYRLDGTVATLHQSDEITGESALPDFRCKVAQFFPEPIK